MSEQRTFFKPEKLFLAQSLDSTMNPAFCMAKCFGLWHFTYQTHHGILKSKLSIPLTIFHVVLLLIANSAYAIHFVLWVNDMPKYPIVSFSLVLQSVVSMVCNVIAFYTCCVHNQKIMSIFHLINDLEQYLKNSKAVYSGKRRMLIFQIMFVMIGTFISIVVSWQSVGANTEYIFMYMCFFVNDMCNSSLELQYLTFVSLIREHFCAVNIKLDEGRELTNVLSPNKCSKVYNMQRITLRRTFQKKCTKMNVSKSTVKKAKMSLKNVIMYHDSLCDIVQLVNNVYSIFVLLSITKMFLSVSYTLFITLSKILKPSYTRSDNVLDIVTFRNEVTPWCTIYTIKFFYLIYMCSITSDEANKAAVFVHKLITITNVRTIKEQLQHFSLQLIHRKVQLTASGFFPVDFTLLYSIITAVATYLVILIQFQLSVECSNDLLNATNWYNP